MEKLKIVIKKYWKIYLAALVISVICDLIGTLKLNIGIGTLTLFPMVFAVIFGGLLGPDIFKLFKSDECKNRRKSGSCCFGTFYGKNGHFFRCKPCETGFSRSSIASSGIRKSWNNPLIYAACITSWFKKGIYWCMLLN